MKPVNVFQQTFATQGLMFAGAAEVASQPIATTLASVDPTPAPKVARQAAQRIEENSQGWVSSCEVVERRGSWFLCFRLTELCWTKEMFQAYS